MSEFYINQATQQYSANVALLLQEEGYKLRGLVMQGSHEGKQASPVNQVGSVAMRKVNNRFAPKVHTHASHTRRWVFPNDAVLDQPIDSFDQLKTIVDVKSAYAENASKAAGREMDDNIIDAAFADAKTGETASTTESFDTTSTSTGGASVDVDFKAAGSVGLTTKKLIEAKRRFRAAHVDLEMDPRTMIIGSNQESDLLNQEEVVNMDYSNRPVLVDGNISRFMGYNFVISERLNTSTGSTVRDCIALVRSGMHLGIWEEVNSDAHIRYDLEGNPWELTTKMSVGATRLEQYKVLRVLCSEA